MLHLCHGEFKKVLWVTGVHEEVIPGVGYDGIFIATLLSGVILGYKGKGIER